MSSVPPSTPQNAIRRMAEDSWIAISLVALLGAAIIACAALASLYLQGALATDLLIGLQQEQCEQCLSQGPTVPTRR